MARTWMILLAFMAVLGQPDDDAWHVEASDEGTFHVHLDGGNSAALLVRNAMASVPATPQGPPDMATAALPSPTIAGLLRPPMPRSS
jgi:hypothetical protein